MPKILDLTSWKRRKHFEFFRDYEHPFFNLCAEVDVTELAERCERAGGPSFFLSSLFLSLKAANEVEELRYRIRGDQVVVHDVIHGGSTVLAPDETFVFAYFDFEPDFPRFERSASAVLDHLRDLPGKLEARPERDDLIHYSVIPWVRFTSFAHARKLDPRDSVPKIVFGRHYEEEGRRRMPVSVEVHHSLVDGIHVGRYYELFQELLDQPDLNAGPG